MKTFERTLYQWGDVCFETKDIGCDWHLIESPFITTGSLQVVPEEKKSCKSLKVLHNMSWKSSWGLFSSWRVCKFFLSFLGEGFWRRTRELHSSCILTNSFFQHNVNFMYSCKETSQPWMVLEFVIFFSSIKKKKLEKKFVFLLLKKMRVVSKKRCRLIYCNTSEVHGDHLFLYSLRIFLVISWHPFLSLLSSVNVPCLLSKPERISQYFTSRICSLVSNQTCLSFPVWWWCAWCSAWGGWGGIQRKERKETSLNFLLEERQFRVSPSGTRNSIEGMMRWCYSFIDWWNEKLSVFDTLHAFSLEGKSSCDLEGEVKSESVWVTEMPSDKTPAVTLLVSRKK